MECRNNNLRESCTYPQWRGTNAGFRRTLRMHSRPSMRRLRSRQASTKFAFASPRQTGPTHRLVCVSDAIRQYLHRVLKVRRAGSFPAGRLRASPWHLEAWRSGRRRPRKSHLRPAILAPILRPTPLPTPHHCIGHRLSKIRRTLQEAVLLSPAFATSQSSPMPTVAADRSLRSPHLGGKRRHYLLPLNWESPRSSAPLAQHPC